MIFVDVNAVAMHDFMLYTNLSTVLRLRVLLLSLFCATFSFNRTIGITAESFRPETRKKTD